MLRFTAIASCFFLAACTVPAPSFMGTPASDLLRAGENALAAGDVMRAEELLNRAEGLASKESDCRVRIAALRALAFSAERRGEIDAAATRHAMLRDAADACDDLESSFFGRINEARLRIDQGDMDALRSAAGLVEAARFESVAIGTLSARGEYLVLRARIQLAEGAIGASEETAREAVRTFDLQGASLERALSHARARIALAAALAANGDSLAEIAELRTAAALAHDAGDRLLEANAHERISASLAARGLSADARYWLEQALEDREAATDRRGALVLLDRLEAMAAGEGLEDRVAEYRAMRKRLAPE